MNKMTVTGIVLLLLGTLALVGNRIAQSVFHAQWGGPNFAAGAINIGAVVFIAVGLGIAIAGAATNRRAMKPR